jgi:hypothetical protein
VQVHTPSNTGDQSYEQKERAALIQKIKEFYDRFGYVPLPDGCVSQSIDLVAMERRLLAAIASRKPERKPEAQSPFVRQKEAVKLLGCRQTLERCEKAGWLTATTRRARLVQYKRQDVMAAVYRISQGEYP